MCEPHCTMQRSATTRKSHSAGQCQDAVGATGQHSNELREALDAQQRSLAQQQGAQRSGKCAGCTAHSSAARLNKIAQAAQRSAVVGCAKRTWQHSAVHAETRKVHSAAQSSIVQGAQRSAAAKCVRFMAHRSAAQLPKAHRAQGAQHCTAQWWCAQNAQRCAMFIPVCLLRCCVAAESTDVYGLNPIRMKELVLSNTDVNWVVSVGRTYKARRGRRVVGARGGGVWSWCRHCLNRVVGGSAPGVVVEGGGHMHRAMVTALVDKMPCLDSIRMVGSESDVNCHVVLRREGAGGVIVAGSGAWS